MDTMIPDGGEAPPEETDAEREARFAWEAKAVAEALASFEAGYYVTEEEVDAWIDSIGTDHELPIPYPLYPRSLDGR